VWPSGWGCRVSGGRTIRGNTPASEIARDAGADRDDQGDPPLGGLHGRLLDVFERKGMQMAGEVRRIAPGERTEGAPTPGMIREQAVATDHMWAGLVRTEAGMVSGWHHHGGYESTIYVLSGALRMEFGPGGAEVLEAGPGDFLYVAPGAVHRESNPRDEESHVVVVRSGSGESVVNVDRPE
jgi:uncharacterized RmlC-like cupin family protein